MTVAPLPEGARLLAECIDSEQPFCGVPCSVLQPWMDAMGVSGSRFQVFANEGQAVAYCAGAWVAGTRAVAYMQNSGLGNAVNAFTSLLLPFEMPLLVLVGWRGMPGQRDEPQHRHMGQISWDLLRLCGVDTFTLSGEGPNDLSIPDQVRSRLRENRRCGILLPPLAGSRPRRDDQARDVTGRITRATDPAEAAGPGRVPVRQAIEVCCEELDAATAVVATTGYASRELFALADGANKFYMVGSMGHASAFGLGIAERARVPVVVLDGDGALLMQLGSMASVGASGARLVHVLLNNQVHDSTGGQPVAGAGSLDFLTVAKASGYRNVWACSTISQLRDRLKKAREASSPSFLDVRVTLHAQAALPRIPDSLPGMAERFRHFLATRIDSTTTMAPSGPYSGPTGLAAETT